MHDWPAQSTSIVQLDPMPHGGQSPPPQSTSVSFRFFTLSTQLPWAQTPSLQYAPTQSASWPQCAPMVQRGHALPPQSTSLSSPSRTLFVHEIRCASELSA